MPQVIRTEWKPCLLTPRPPEVARRSHGIQRDCSVAIGSSELCSKALFSFKNVIFDLKFKACFLEGLHSAHYSFIVNHLTTGSASTGVQKGRRRISSDTIYLQISTQHLLCSPVKNLGTISIYVGLKSRKEPCNGIEAHP